MSRNIILALGAVAWTLLAGSAIALYSIGHWQPPTITIIVGAAWVTMRVVRTRMSRRRSIEATA